MSQLDEIRTKFTEFYGTQNHSQIPSASLIPDNDPTTLFTGSGMQPLLPYLLGQPHPSGHRLVNSQKCFRSEDIQEIGDNRHTTFFEMLGNWSLGDYFKEQQLTWFYTFLTDSKRGIGLDPTRIFVTVFAGDEKYSIPRDEESVSIWQKLFATHNLTAEVAEMITESRAAATGMQGARIFYYDAAKNWWSRSGPPNSMPAGEPGGPDSEVFYDFQTPHNPAFGKHCHPNCDCGRFMEIGNSVFMQYQKTSDGSFTELDQRNVDFGGGLERLVAASRNEPDIFKIDVFESLIRHLEESANRPYSDPKAQKSYRIVADHTRAAVFIMADGVMPSNTEAGYFVRRLVRRSIRHLDLLGLPTGSLAPLISILADDYTDTHFAIKDQASYIASRLTEEENKFRRTINAGIREFSKIAENPISGTSAFKLFSTYGLPKEIIEDLAKEQKRVMDSSGFDREYAAHQKTSRQGSTQKFKGGLADHSDMSVKYHTATHLLHQALRDVLGEHVYQKGSNITPERLRFDFVHFEKLTPDQVTAVEERVNEQIKAALPVTHTEMSVKEAKGQGALGLFEDKYGTKVSVYSIGNFSCEICGGPHVENTSELGTFEITKEQSASSGVRRIRAILRE